MNEAFLGMITSWTGLFGTIGLTMAGYLAQRYVIPFLKIGKRQNYATYISVIADELIDELRLKYPDKKWLEHLDDLLERLVDICSISPEIASRALRASAARK